MIAPWPEWPKWLQIVVLAPLATVFGILCIAMTGWWPVSAERRRRWGLGLAFVIGCCWMAVYAWSR